MRASVIVSVVIPVFNTASYLSKCLESVIRQTCEDLEIICVNDGSTDDSLGILQRYCRLDPRILVIDNKENKGTAFSRNLGMDKATGKYIYFLDSDDYVESFAMEELTSYADANKTECLYFDTRVIDDTSNSTRSLKYCLDDVVGRVISGPDLFVLMDKRNTTVDSVCRCLFLRDFLLRNHVRFPSGMLSEDQPFSLRAILCSERCSVLNKEFHIYCRHTNSSSTKATPQKTVSLIKHYIDLLCFWEELDYFTQEVQESIDRRMEHYLTIVKQEYRKTKYDIKDTNFKVGKERHLYRVIFEQKYEKYLRFLEQDIQNRIRKHSPIIVYGAGRIGGDVIEKLKANQIEIDYIAVTKITSNATSYYNIPVKEIHELLHFKDTGIIVLGVSLKIRKEIISNLKNIGFYNYIAIDEYEY